MQGLSSEKAKKGAAKPLRLFVFMAFILVFIVIASILSLVAIGILVTLSASAIVVAAAIGGVLLVSAVIAGFASWRIAKEVYKTEDLEVPQERGCIRSPGPKKRVQDKRKNSQLNGLEELEKNHAYEDKSGPKLKTRLLALFRKAYSTYWKKLNNEYINYRDLYASFGSSQEDFSCEVDGEKLKFSFVGDNAWSDFEQFKVFFPHVCKCALNLESLDSKDYSCNVDFDQINKHVTISESFIEKLEAALEQKVNNDNGQYTLSQKPK